MRFVVVPLSSKSVFVFCQHRIAPPILIKSAAASRTAIPTRSTPRLDDRIVAKAQATWQSWEASNSKMKQRIVKWANLALEKIPFEEYSLKSIPPLGRVLRKVEDSSDDNKSSTGKEVHIKVGSQPSDSSVVPVQVLFPGNVISKSQSAAVLKNLAENGVVMHWKYMWISLVVSPLTLPLALLPVIPNLPGIYLMYRAYSNFRAYQGAQHLKYLVDHSATQLEYFDYAPLNDAYRGVEPITLADTEKKSCEEKIVLDSGRITEIGTCLDATMELRNELKRAVHQIEKKERKKQAYEQT